MITISIDKSGIRDMRSQFTLTARLACTLYWLASTCWNVFCLPTTRVSTRTPHFLFTHISICLNAHMFATETAEVCSCEQHTSQTSISVFGCFALVFVSLEIVHKIVIRFRFFFSRLFRVSLAIYLIADFCCFFFTILPIITTDKMIKLITHERIKYTRIDRIRKIKCEQCYYIHNRFGLCVRTAAKKFN